MRDSSERRDERKQHIEKPKAINEINIYPYKWNIYINDLDLIIIFISFKNNQIRKLIATRIMLICSWIQNENHPFCFRSHSPISAEGYVKNLLEASLEQKEKDAANIGHRPFSLKRKAITLLFMNMFVLIRPKVPRRTRSPHPSPCLSF